MHAKWVPPPQHTPYPNLVRDSGVLLSFLLESEHIPQSMKDLFSRLDPEDVAHIALVWRYNSFGHHTDTNALCMYDVTSMMAHSCLPSAVWQFGEDDSFCLRARVAVKEGDELCISYLGEDDLAKSVSIRQHKTGGWLFSCACSRCVDQRLDFSRGFRCPSCLLGSIFFASKDPDSGGACTACGAEMESEEKRKRLDLETLYAERVAVTDKSDIADVCEIYRESLNLFTNQHWVPYILLSYMTECWKTGGDIPPGRRIHALKKRIEFLDKTFPVANYTVACLWEEVGDCFAAMNCKEEAAECFDTAYWTYRILLGYDHPSAAAVYVKHENCKNS